MNIARHTDRQYIVRLMNVCANHFEEDMRNSLVMFGGKEISGTDFAGILLLAVDGLLSHDQSSQMLARLDKIQADNEQILAWLEKMFIDADPTR